MHCRDVCTRKKRKNWIEEKPSVLTCLIFVRKGTERLDKDDVRILKRILKDRSYCRTDKDWLLDKEKEKLKKLSLYVLVIVFCLIIVFFFVWQLENGTQGKPI